MLRTSSSPTHFPFGMTPTLLLFATSMLLLLTASGCQSKTSDRDIVMVDVSDAIDATQGERGLFSRRAAGVWVDVRSEEDYRKERIPGALHMPLDTARQDHVILEEYDTIVVYGHDRSSPRAFALSKLLLELGHKDVRTLLGGFAAWKQAGQPVEGD